MSRARSALAGIAEALLIFAAIILAGMAFVAVLSFEFVPQPLRIPQPYAECPPNDHNAWCQR